MSYVVIAQWTAKPGSEDDVAAAIEKLIAPSRAEPGCLAYRAQRNVTDDAAFLLYEEYVDEAAYAAHGESEHFKRYGLGEGIPLLASRERAFYRPLDADAA
jgi:(4S)-4-hydroxy-5-phosphonooxypentane-2,3-dione isomerase